MPRYPAGADEISGEEKRPCINTRTAAIQPLPLCAHQLCFEGSIMRQIIIKPFYSITSVIADVPQFSSAYEGGDNHAALAYANARYNELCANIDSLQDLLKTKPIDYRIFKKNNSYSAAPLSDDQYRIFTHLANLRKERKEIEYAIDSIKLIITGKVASENNHEKK